MSDTSSSAPRVPPSALVYPDVYLPEDLAQTAAARAEAAHVSPSELLASLIERFVREHAGEPQEPTGARAGAEPPGDAQDAWEAWDTPGMVRRIVPLPEEVARAVAQLAATWQRPVNDLICDAVQAAFGAGDGPAAASTVQLGHASDE
jgi:hypothetical protein